MRRWLVGIVVAVGLHAVFGWALVGSRVAAQLLSPGPHAIAAAAFVLAFVLLRLFVLVLLPGLLVVALLALLERTRPPVVR